MPRVLAAARRLIRTLTACLGACAAHALAATATNSAAFGFTHTGAVSTGLLAVAGTFTTPTTTNAPAVALPLFDPALGHLNKVTLTVATTTASFAVTQSGLVSVLATGSATRQLGYTVTAGGVPSADGAQVTTSGAALLTLLSSGSAEIGGAPLASSLAFTGEADLRRFTGPGTASVAISATDTLSVFTLVSLANGASMSGSGTYAGTAGVAYDYTPYRLSGQVFADADRDGFRAPTESGTGLALYAKLLSSSGAVLQVAAVDPATGRYGFDVAAGSYRVLVDDNASTTDTTPLVPPPGWSATHPVSLQRAVVVTNDLPGQDFGLAAGTALSGRVFVDDGAGGGVANDGVRNGAERGYAARLVQLLDAAGTVLAAATTDAGGAYRLYVPTGVANGAALRLIPASDGSVRVTGAAPGGTGGTFQPALRGLTFTFSNAAASTGVDFGAIPVAVPTPAGTQAGAPGTVLFFRHAYTAGTAGQLTFQTSHAGPAGLAWSEDIYVDANGNGLVDADEPPLSGALGVVAGQTVALIVKIALPASAAPGMRLHTVLRADLLLANATPATTVSSSVVDDAEVVSAQGSALQLIKSTSTATVAPGGTVVYTIRFVNMGSGPVDHLQINDATPPFTTFVTAAAPTLPSSLTGAATTLPAAGASGALQWTFTGALAPNAEGSVQFVVQING